MSDEAGTTALYLACCDAREPMAALDGMADEDVARVLRRAVQLGGADHPEGVPARVAGDAIAVIVERFLTTHSCKE